MAARLALSNRYYNIRADAIGGRATFTPDMNPRGWADFRQVALEGLAPRRHLAHGRWQRGEPRRFTYVIDGIARSAPNPNRTMTTPTLRCFADTRPGSVQSIYFDDVEVGIGVPKAFSQALFVGRVLPACWRTDSNGYADVEGWIVDIEIYDANDTLLATLERRLPKKDPVYTMWMVQTTTQG